MSASGVGPQLSHAPPRVEFDLGSKVDVATDSIGTYFKSSFAKSMALSSEHQSKSLDCSALNAALRARADPEFTGVRVGTRACGRAGSRAGASAGAAAGVDVAVKARRDSCIPRGGPAPVGAQGQSAPENGLVPVRKTREDASVGSGASQDAAAKELARLRKELQNLQEENRRLQTSHGGGGGGGGQGGALQADTAQLVDSVLLQNQVDTLQWQLRQTENSRDMHRAVMEQVVRFLERAHRNLKLAASSAQPRPKTPNGRVPRSRSVHTVDACPGRDSASPRLQDSLPDFQRAKSITQIEDTQSYSAFRDFTWRRPRPSQSDLEEVPPEKLSQEAFRLLRTVQSLLNTREPDLAHRLSMPGSGSPSHSGDSEPRSEPRSERSSVVSLDHPDDASQTSQTSPTPTAGGASSGAALVADVTGALRRKLNIRNSQVVSCASYNRLRGSAESNSNSSSSTAEDCDFDGGPASLLSGLGNGFGNGLHGAGGGNRLEEARQALRKEEAVSVVFRSKQQRQPRQPPTPQPSLSLSSAEDESGFSSMGSFQEVGLPLLSSTQLHEQPWAGHAASPSPSPSASSRSHGSFHEVGLPLPRLGAHGKPPVPIHRRWSSNPVEALSRTAYKGAEALRVLWV